MSITKTKAGTYKVRVDMGTTIDGRRDQKQATFKTLREARKWETAMDAQRDAMRGRSGKIRLRDYIDGWYRPLMESLAASSRDTYEREIRLRILPALGNVDVRDIDRAGIQRMLDSCATLSVGRKALGALKTILNEAVSDGILQSNPALLRYRMPPEGKKRDNGLVIGTFAEMGPVFAALADYADDGTCAKLAATGLLMGLRPEERYGLDWEDIDWEDGVATIERAYLQVSRKEDVHDLKGTKTENGRRIVPVPADAAAILRPLRSHGKVIECGPLMKGPDGRRISPSTAQKRWARFLRLNPDVPPVTIENMRHSFATSFLAAGGNVENLSRILGHADINTTFKRYVRPTAGNLKADMERVRVAV